MVFTCSLEPHFSFIFFRPYSTYSTNLDIVENVMTSQKVIVARCDITLCQERNNEFENGSRLSRSCNSAIWLVWKWSGISRIRADRLKRVVVTTTGILLNTFLSFMCTRDIDCVEFTIMNSIVRVHCNITKENKICLLYKVH